jgi:hypothetical protein
VKRGSPIIGVAVLLLLIPAGASAAPLPPAPAEDSAVGSHETVSLFTLRFEFSARSGPSGEEPSGSFSLQFGETGFPPDFNIEGPVTCLQVEGRNAVLGVASGARGDPGGTVVAVHDATNSPDDPFDLLGFYGTAEPPGSNDCPAPSSLPPLTPFGSDFWGQNFFASLGPDPGAIAVHDAEPLPTSKDQCKSGGWRTYGVFKNQGDCVSFVATGGKNPPRA